MKGIYHYKRNQPITWYSRSLASSNQYCLYCGRLVGEGASVQSNREHLIGREFIPTGTFGKGNLFNFIFRACKECNDEKSSLERHISTVTLFNSPTRACSKEHNDLAKRKAEKDYHPTKKGTLVKDSGDEFTMSAKYGPTSISFGLSGPPQADQRYIEFLAFKHIQGIFSLITSKNPLSAEGTTLLDPKYFYFYEAYGHLDWGNTQLLEIMSRAQKIPCYANIDTANGFFKAIMRRTEGDSCEWFWALEWNKSLRIVGAIAPSKSVPTIFEDLPDINWKDLQSQDGIINRIRREAPLDPELDVLFLAEI